MISRLRLAARLAWRDVRAHRIASALIVAMIGVPVLLLVAALTQQATSDIDAHEATPGLLGAAQARIVAGADGPVEQAVDGSVTTVRCGGESMGGYGRPVGDHAGWDASEGQCPRPTARTIPGLATPGSTRATATALRALTGATDVTAVRALTVTTSEADATRPTARVLEIDGRNPLTAGMVTLTSGRWPTAPGEVLTTAVTSADLHGGVGGLAPDGEHTGSPTAVRVVGTARTAPGATPFGQPDYIRLPGDDLSGMTFLLGRPTPVSWAEVRRLNEYGLTVLSRDVLDHPSAETDVAVAPASQEVVTSVGILSVVTVALLLEGCLVAGPAFAVVAARRRRDLALIAATGARVGDLRGILVTQALLLGVISAAVGAVLGVALVPAFAAVANTIRPGFVENGPLDVPWAPVLAVTGAAVVAAFVSGLVPARSLGSLDLRAAVDSEGVAPAPPRPRFAVLGAALLLAGIALWWWISATDLGVVGTSGTPDAPTILAAGLATVVGALFLAPAVLHACASAAGRIPSVPLRLAIRDASRRRSRTVPTVAAVTGASMLLCGLGITYFSLEAAAVRDHRAVAPPGGIAFEAGDDATDRLARDVLRLAPAAATAALSGPTDDDRRPWVVASAACDVTTLADRGTGPCAGAVGEPAGRRIIVVDAAEAARLFSLDTAARQALDRGAVLVTGPAPTAGAPVVAQRVEVADGAVRGRVERPHPVRTHTAPGVPFQVAGEGVGALLTPTTARSLGMDPYPMRRIIWQPGGDLPDDVMTTVEESEPYTHMGTVSVERGVTEEFRVVRIVLGIVFGVLVALAAVTVLTATLLGVTEARADLAVLTAVGAARSFARRAAALQTAFLAAIGCALGFVVALAPGVAIAVSATTTLPQSQGGAEGAGYLDHVRHSLVVVPWGPLLLGLIVVCGSSAGIAALATRPSPALSRRPS